MSYRIHRKGTGALLISVSGKTLRRANLARADLSGAELNETDLSGAELNEANLSGANLARAYLTDAYLAGAELSGADLNEANLARADLRGADLNGANLSGANLTDAYFNGANLSGANLSGAYLSGANLNGANLSGAAGLADQSDWMREHMESSVDGYIGYKRFGEVHAPAPSWRLEPGEVLSEVVNPDRATECGSGVNVSTMGWQLAQKAPKGHLWKLLIPWSELASVVVPYSGSGKLRCGRVKLLKKIEEPPPPACAADEPPIHGPDRGEL